MPVASLSQARRQEMAADKLEIAHEMGASHPAGKAGKQNEVVRAALSARAAAEYLVAPVGYTELVEAVTRVRRGEKAG